MNHEMTQHRLPKEAPIEGHNKEALGRVGVCLPEKGISQLEQRGQKPDRGTVGLNQKTNEKSPSGLVPPPLGCESNTFWYLSGTSSK